MIGEIIAVGTEILMGQITNTNATFLAEELGGLGIDVYYQSVVGDNKERLTDIIKLASSRSDVVILCGGLGPTDDDITKQTLAEFLGEDLIEDEQGCKQILHHFERTGRNMTSNNMRQALFIENGQALPNSNGLAVGTFYQQKESQTAYLLVPGPPSELKPMFAEYAKPLLMNLVGEQQIFTSKVLRFYGIGESQLVTDLDELITKQTNPTIAPYAKSNEVTIRITAKTKEQAEGERLVEDMKQQILSIVGEHFYGEGDNFSLAECVVNELLMNNKTITAMESLTAGLFQSTIGDIPGVSNAYPGGFVSYSNELKIGLGVSQDTLEQFGAISEECASEMSSAALKRAQTDYALAFTGVAGPDTAENQAVGTTWIALATKDQIITKKFIFNRNRQYIRHSAVMAGLWMLHQELNK